MSFVSHSPFQLQGRYAERNKWEVLGGPGDSRVTGLQIVDDEGIADAWQDKVVLITGVSAGIGVETVRAIVKTGATVYGTARDLDKARSALGSLIATGRVKLLLMDQASLESVEACAEAFREQSQKLNIIINNAAVSWSLWLQPRYCCLQSCRCYVFADFIPGHEHAGDAHDRWVRATAHDKPPVSLFAVLQAERLVNL